MSFLITVFYFELLTYKSMAEVGNPRLQSRMWLFCLPSAALLLFFEASECEMILTLTTGKDLFFFFFWKTLMTYAPYNYCGSHQSPCCGKQVQMALWGLPTPGLW